MNVRNTAAWFVVITLAILLLSAAQSILIPFVIALLIWFVIKKVRNLLDKIEIVKTHVPPWIKTIISSLAIFYFIFVVIQLLTAEIQGLTKSYPTYATNVEIIALKLNDLLQINIREELISGVNNFDFTVLLQLLFNSLSDTLSNMVMIIFYVTFMIVEEGLFLRKLKMIFGNQTKYDSALTTIQKVDNSMSRYISLKSLVNLLSAGISFVILSAVGIETPIFWAFLIFLFNFIPSVGPIMGTLFPTLFALLQFGDFVPSVVIFFGVGTAVMLIGSLVEPKLMGNTLNISPLVAILALAIWGTLWGITGMLLSVPITVAMIILLSQFESTRPVAILLSEKGRV
jgi:predicted PurR-regulated permease PerM